jgi:ammonium transporter, Amt family
MIPYIVEVFEIHLFVDDPGGSVTVHAVSGIWGLLAVAIVGDTRTAAETASGQWLAQLVGIATLIGFVLPLTYATNWLQGRFVPQRVARDAERYGLDIHELGAGAYPEFVVHSDEFVQR